MTKEQEKALKLIEDSMNKKCNGLECKVVKNNIDLRLEIIQLNKQIDLMAKYLAINGVERDICNEKRIKENCKNVTVDNITVHRCKECIKQYFKEIAEESSTIN